MGKLSSDPLLGDGPQVYPEFRNLNPRKQSGHGAQRIICPLSKRIHLLRSSTWTGNESEAASELCWVGDRAIGESIS